MKLPNDKTVKILLRNGQVIMMYADDQTIWKVKNDYDFVAFRDNGNDIHIRLNDISAFEVMDDRKEAPQENAEAPSSRPSEV